MAYGKNRQWAAILYPENMREDWRDEIDGLVQLPYAYCLHDKGLELEQGDHRKEHLHLILVWPAPTTQKHAMEVFGRLSAPGRRALSTCEPVYNARRIYDYLIHDTEDSRKKGKFKFDPSERITGNNYDIGAYVQVSQTEKNEAFDNLTAFILDNHITNFAQFVAGYMAAFSDQRELYRDVVRGWSGYFERLIKGNFHHGKNAAWAKYCDELQEKRRKREAAAGAGDADRDGSHEEFEGIDADDAPQESWRADRKDDLLEDV